jgi:hypothetical protein
MVTLWADACGSGWLSTPHLDRRAPACRVAETHEGGNSFRVRINRAIGDGGLP